MHASNEVAARHAARRAVAALAGPHLPDAAVATAAAIVAERALAALEHDLLVQVEQQLCRRLAQHVSAIETALRRSELETQAITAGKAAVSA
jgi:hypothetical protein